MLSRDGKNSFKDSCIRIAIRIATEISCCKSRQNPSISFRVILLTDRQTNTQGQKHNLLGWGNNTRRLLMVFHKDASISTQMKTPLRETQTLRVGCSKAEPKNFAPPQTPFLGARDGQNLISWKWSLPLPKTQFGEDWCTQFRVIVVTDPQTHKQTHRQTETGPITLHCAANLSVQCNQLHWTRRNADSTWIELSWGGKRQY